MPRLGILKAEILRYSAFISYNHKDRHWAAWLHRQLENYRVPQRIRGRVGPVGVIGARLPPVFQDREELASSSDLAKSVQDALAEAATLVVICSPNAARSRWVNEEIRTFRKLGRSSFIQCLMVSGQPFASGDPTIGHDLECFPPALFEDGGLEPLAADLRPEADGKYGAKLKLLAGILGVSYNELRRREATRRNKRLAIVAAAAVLGFVVMSGLAIFALFSRQEALAQRDLARQKTLTAERTVDFIKSMFEVADPSEAKGTTITAREILDRATRRISSSLADEPTVKAELMTTLGEVYSGLGLFNQGGDLIRETFQLKGRDPATDARQYAALGEVEASQGDYKGAIVSFQNGLAVARNPHFGQSDLIARLLEGLSESESALDNYAAAERDAQEGLKIQEARFGSNAPETARALEALALNDFFAGRLATARASFERAYQIRLHIQGSLHPKVTEDLSVLGSIAYLQQDTATAEQYYRQVLTNYEAVLGPRHPDLAGTLANLGRVLLEQRNFSAAASMLQRAVDIYVSERGKTHDDLAFIYANLALTKRELGDPVAAKDLFNKAISIARLQHHRNLAPAMTDLADTLCEYGAQDKGLAILEEARPIMVSAYPDDPWRVAWLDNVRGACLWKAGNREAGTQLMRLSAKILQQRWKSDSFYGYAVVKHLKLATN